MRYIQVLMSSYWFLLVLIGSYEINVSSYCYLSVQATTKREKCQAPAHKTSAPQSKFPIRPPNHSETLRPLTEPP